MVNTGMPSVCLMPGRKTGDRHVKDVIRSPCPSPCRGDSEARLFIARILILRILILRILILRTLIVRILIERPLIACTFG